MQIKHTIILLVASVILAEPLCALASIAPPQNLSYQSGSLVWNAVQGADYYLVGQADHFSGPYHQLTGKHLAPNAVVSDLGFGRHYYFVVYTVGGNDKISQASAPMDVFLKLPPKRRKLSPYQTSPFLYTRKHGC